MLIGLGGGAASSQTSAEESAELDFASVQRYVLTRNLYFPLKVRNTIHVLWHSTSADTTWCSALSLQWVILTSKSRANAEVQRRAQEVINACVALGPDNPIKFIHDVGAGGLSNALPELLHDTNLGSTFELREIDNADRGMSAMQIWCNGT